MLFYLFLSKKRIIHYSDIRSVLRSFLKHRRKNKLKNTVLTLNMRILLLSSTRTNIRQKAADLLIKNNKRQQALGNAPFAAGKKVKYIA